MPYEFDRAHYRIEYPPSARPRFVAANGTVWPVDNCSERGFRYQTGEARLPESALPAVGTPVVGRLEFRDGASAVVAGAVVRVSNGDVAVQLEDTSVPLAIIWAEQRYLRSRYPERFGA